MNLDELVKTARGMVAPGKGILAADESSPTIKKRFDGISVESTEESRRSYRELLLTAAGAAEHISGVILYDETIRQNAADGTPFPEVLASQGIFPGIKVDTGAKELAGFPGEKITEGLDGLRDRLIEYRGYGAKFAKWRGVIDIAAQIPTDFCLDANAHALARYAALCQEQEIVPIVEPEVLMDGSHSIDVCYDVTFRTLRRVFAALAEHRVALEGIILKPNMVIAGKKCDRQAGPQEVAERTIQCFRNTVPAAVTGICFLSGGQSDEQATANLNAMNAMGTHPWEVSFSYGRALQTPALAAWSGKAENVAAGQAAYLLRARCNGAARYGKYSSSMEKAA